MRDATTLRATSEAVRDALRVVNDVRQRHRIAALDDFLQTCQSFAAEEKLNVAILGRFKVGKSSFLNHLIGRPLLPVGAVPVTTVVTEIEYGPRDRAEVRFKNGNAEQIPLECIIRLGIAQVGERAHNSVITPAGILPRQVCLSQMQQSA